MNLYHKFYSSIRKTSLKELKAQTYYLFHVEYENSIVAELKLPYHKCVGIPYSPVHFCYYEVVTFYKNLEELKTEMIREILQDFERSNGMIQWIKNWKES